MLLEAFGISSLSAEEINKKCLVEDKRWVSTVKLALAAKSMNLNVEFYSLSLIQNEAHLKKEFYEVSHFL